MNPISSSTNQTQQLGNHPLLRPRQNQSVSSQKPTQTQTVSTQPQQNTHELSQSNTTAPKKKATQLPDFLAKKVYDIQQVASQVGYVDLSEGAIVSAMKENRSLLVDYKA